MILHYRVHKLSDINEKIVSFFQKYPILGVKSKDFEDFCKVAEMIKKGEHLTDQGSEQIRKIKAGTNRGRVH